MTRTLLPFHACGCGSNLYLFSFFQAPGLAVVLVGNRPDSATYVRMKKKACKEVGINDFGIAVDEDISQEELVERVKELNENPMVDGILVQVRTP